MGSEKNRSSATHFPGGKKPGRQLRSGALPEHVIDTARSASWIFHFRLCGRCHSTRLRAPAIAIAERPRDDECRFSSYTRGRCVARTLPGPFVFALLQACFSYRIAVSGRYAAPRIVSRA